MEFMNEWITNIILFVLLATIIDLLLPNSKFQNYTKMVTGLLLITVILSPILKFLSFDPESSLSLISQFETEEEKNIENQIEHQKKEIQASFDAYILEEMAVQLKEIAEEELIEKFGLEIARIDLVKDEQSQGEYESIIVQLKEPVKDAETIETIKKVEINTSEPLPSNDRAIEKEQITSLLAKIWDVERETIQVAVEGGNT